MAGIITISAGHDASYPWRQIGTSDRSPEPASGKGPFASRSLAAAYYLSPAERGGEPPGIWTGLGVAELGLTPGGTVRREVFEPLYGQHLDPRDPSGQSRLGRALGTYRTASQIYEALLAAEPHATAERRAELMTEAKTKVRTADMYWDATFSVSKSISLLHASALANAAAADAAGDHDAARAWTGIAGGVWDAIMEGNNAALEYLQREAGQTRAGYHPGGRWEDARQWAIASFRQHTSRDGDPQLHVHNLILHKVRRESDGLWRALDSMSLYRHRPAASAIAAMVMENALTARFGVRWVQRQDGHGREIADVTQALMDQFSSRRASIGPLTARLAQEYQARHGRAPDARALTTLRQWANHATRRAKPHEPLDTAGLVRRWSAQAAASEAGALEPLAPAILRPAVTRTATTTLARPAPSSNRAAAPASPRTAPPGREPPQRRQPQTMPAPLSDAQAERLIMEAVASVQAAQPTWTEADLIRHLGERLPAATGPMTTSQASALLPALARRALGGEGIVSLTAPEWPLVPDSLRRADGESVYAQHGAARYATTAQLGLEERILAHAAETTAPHLDPATAAAQLGANPEILQAHLSAQPGPAAGSGASAGRTGSGLRLDQAAAAFFALTCPRRAVVLAGPAGSGKTRTVAELARIWRETGAGEVIGLTTSQTAANVLAQAGGTRAHNTAHFLGHTEHQREALAPMAVAPGSLLILDEASMISTPDMAAILAIAHRHDCKVIITGDHEQLAAIGGGGAMALLTARHGYVQLTEPQRFTSEWERDATLRLREGDLSVLTEYDQHGRFRAGTADEATEHAYRAWLTDYLDGKDTVLLARTQDQARELSRRARDDLIRYGHVQPGPVIPLSEGEQASPGDLIMARRNTRVVTSVGERSVANRDILKLTAIPGPATAEVRRLTGHDPATGRLAWSRPFRISRAYLARHASLAYATTAHAALGRTTDTAHVLIDGLGDRQGLYVAMSRGREANTAYASTESPRQADTTPGTRPDPELDRTRRLTTERTAATGGPEDQNQPQDPVKMVAGVLARDGAVLSATETLRRAQADADDLAVLGGIWDDLTRRARHKLYEQALRDTLPEHLADQAIADPAKTWLYRTLREAETRGHDPRQILTRAVAVRPMTGARDPARILDARIRRTLDQAPYQPKAPWPGTAPPTADADLDRYLRDLAEAITGRIRRLAAHTAETQPPWARHALGPLPENDAEARADWEHRAGTIAAYRERYRHADPADPIGPEPARTSPETRAAWHRASTAQINSAGIDLRALTNADLWLRRAAYQQETAWAPPHVGEELRLTRTAARDAHEQAVRSVHEAQAATDPATAERHRHHARAWRALEAKANRETATFTEIQETRRQWETVTDPVRRLAIAADTELRRRHPATRIDPLRPDSAETASTSRTGPSTGVSAKSTPAALGLTLAAAADPVPDLVARIRQNASSAQAKLDQLAGRRPGAAAGVSCLDQARTASSLRERAAVLQPPKPEIGPASRIVREHETARLRPELDGPERG